MVKDVAIEAVAHRTRRLGFRSIALARVSFQQSDDVGLGRCSRQSAEETQQGPINNLTDRLHFSFHFHDIRIFFIKISLSLRHTSWVKINLIVPTFLAFVMFPLHSAIILVKTNASTRRRHSLAVVQ